MPDGSSYGRRGSRLPRLRFRTGRATFTASWLLSQRAFAIGTNWLALPGLELNGSVP
jgi:hypothetical protein